MHWHIVANVPGYLPMSDDDYRVDTIADARSAVKDEAESQAEGYRGRDDIRPEYDDDGLAAYIVTSDPHDLGIVVDATGCSEDHPDGES
jgi:hypothetical protein